MAKFQVIISDPESGTSKSTETEGTKAVPLVGRRMGEVIDGSVVGMAGHRLQITGGSDRDGFPMRPNIHGGVRVSVILSEGVGFQPSKEGERQRKSVRGNVITEDIVQINMKVVEKPKKTERPSRAKKPKRTGSEPPEEAAETT